MEMNKLNIIDYKKNENNFNEYKNNLEKIKGLLKGNTKYESIYNSLNLLNNKNIYIYFLLFQNYDKWININLEKNYDDNNAKKFTLILKYYKFNKDINDKNLYLDSLFINWIFYLYNEYIKYLNSYQKIYRINKIIYIIKETNNIIITLYKANILNINQIFNIIYFILFLFETNYEEKSYSDKIYKVKNYYILKGLFFLLEETTLIIINRANLNKPNEEKENKNNIQYIISFLNELQNNPQINSQLIIMIIIKNNLIQSFMVKILEKINITIIEKYEPQIKNELLNFFSHFIKSNYQKSKIFNSLLNSLKQSFIHLYNFENNKDKIIHDLFINSFYVKFLKKIFFIDKKLSLPLFDTFYFNGYDSQISLNVQNNTFEKSTLFFSFNLIPLKEGKKYTLFLVQKDFDGKKKDLLNLYIQKSETNNKDNNLNDFDLCISLEEKEIQLCNIPKIKSKTLYYIALSFNLNKLIISFFNGKEELFSTEIDKNKKLFDINSISLSFGFYKKKVNVFSGHIGPIIILRNPKSSKELDEFITSILELEKNYKNIVTLNQSSYYFSTEDIHFIKNIKKENEYIIDKYECLLYIVPETFQFYSDGSKVVNHLPNLDNICQIQRDYIVYTLNITLVKYDKGIFNFIMDNGLDYICLLYEFIYQFAENYTREEFQNISFLNDKDIIMKMILSIFKKTLFILDKTYNEINALNFNKSLKQIYLNFFSSIHLISKKYYIIEDLIDYFYNIIKYYYNNISQFIKRQQNINSKNDEFNKNNVIKRINLCFINGLIDFLLSPELYSFNDKNLLLKLFSELTYYFDYIKLNNISEKINQNLYLKLLSFIPHLNNFYNNEINSDIDKKIESDNNNDDNKNTIIKNTPNIKELDVYDIFLKTLKKFFENNPSKSENILNLKSIFKDFDEYLTESNHTFYKFNNFINELIEDNPDLYFNDDKNDKQINSFLKYARKFSNFSNGKEKEDIKNDKQISNKKDLFNKLISILIRIIYTKQRMGRNSKVIKNFKSLLGKIEKTNDLIINISNEIINIINKFLGLTKDVKKENKNKIYTNEDLRNLSSFYFDIFDLILLFINPLENKNNEFINNEKIIIELLEKITNIIKSNIDNNNNNDNCNTINLDNDNNNYIDVIYCLINFLKFYNNILFKKLYTVKFIQNFINICKLFCKSCLIHSNILIEIEENSNILKTPLEAILDICIFYISYSSREYCKKLSNNEINKDTIAEEQNIIYNFLRDLFPKKTSKEESNNYTIFYINDYLRFLIDNKKKQKNDSFYTNFNKEFINYQYIYKLLFNEKKYNFNFSTFFMLKCTGYKKILFELIVKVLLIEPDAKDSLKFDDTLTLLIEVLQKNYNEHEILYSKNKNFFFKKSNTSYTYYSEIKKKIENNLKKNNYYGELDSFILNKIFNNNFDNLYTSIYSGCCTNKKKTQHKLSFEDKVKEKEIPKLLLLNRHAFSSTNLFKELSKEKEKACTLSDEQPSTKFIHRIPEKNDNNSEKDSSNDSELELKVEEDSSSIYFPKSNYEKSPIIDLSNFTPQPKIERNPIKKKTINSFFSLNDASDNCEKKTDDLKQSLIFNNITIESNDINVLPYINYFFEPDEFYLKNAKKEFMMTTFSIYFFDIFFNNETFVLMKKYYLQNFDGIEKSTKLLDYPSKMKNFNNGLEPCLFLKPFSFFFKNKIFPITHKYFCEYMEKNKIHQYEPIILFKKILPEIYLEDKFDKKCELIKINHIYYGHIIGSKKANYIIFEQQKYDFYEELSESNKIPNIKELNELFTLSNINKKPKRIKSQFSYLNDAQKKELKYNKRYKREKFLIILFDEIEEILERRFLLMWQAIEIYLKNGKSYYFNFITKEQCEFIINIFKSNNLTKNKIHMKEFFKNNYKNILSEWQGERLTTYEYLLFINKYGSRTFNDVNQYPIFPWLIREYILDKDNKLNIAYRNFKYPMAGQTEETRILALNRFEDDIETKNKFPSHYGTHYSTSSYIYFYLMREEPYTSLLVKLQGYKHENPDRMFYSLADTLFVLGCGTDNRECIPDFFYKIEQFINLNCSDFQCKSNGFRVDDFILKGSNDPIIIDYDNFGIKNYVQFIFENKQLLDNKIISNQICNWFDIIFGVGQLPEKNMKKSYNIFRKETYEQKTKLNEKLRKMIKKNKKQEEIIKAIQYKIDLIISFGQTPYQLFNEKHPEKEKHKNSKKEKIAQQNDEEDEDDFELNLNKIIWEKNIKGIIEIQPLFFEINLSLGKVFLINSSRQLEIVDTNYYNFDVESKEHFKFKKFCVYQLFHIKFYETIKIQDNPLFYIINPKYAFSSFNDEIINNNDSKHNEYISYYNSYINNLNLKKEKEKEYFTFITCRYMDNSFKIYHLFKSKPKKEIKPISIICEDFVSSCCALNHNQFLVGLKNGKLIKWSIEGEMNEEHPNIILNKQIQAHKKSITIIEINIKLGIIITGGEDNYVFIRKLYDFELITPIKIKSKYIITMAKVSPMNFLYIICFKKNKKNNNSIIFGYTLNGLYFAKSKYGYFDNIDFTRNGNIITFLSKKGIDILSGYNLNSIIANKKDKDIDEIQKKITGAFCIKYNYFSRKNEITNKTITYTNYDKSKGGNAIGTLDVTNNNYFD